MQGSQTAQAETEGPSIDGRTIERRGTAQARTGLISIGWDKIEKMMAEKMMTEAPRNCPLYHRECIRCGAKHTKIRLD